MEYKIVVLCLSVIMSLMPQAKNKEYQGALENARDALNKLRLFM